MESQSASTNFDTPGTCTSRSSFRQELNQLEHLVFGQTTAKRNDQLVLLLHGPGGSGKTATIDLVLAYGKEYYDHLGLLFTKRTIIVSALSGSAATLLLGETTHSAFCLNQRKQISCEQCDSYEGTRLAIVDEASMANWAIIEKLNSNLQMLKKCRHKKFGGVPMVFSADFRQLEPVKAAAMYNDDRSLFHVYVNQYIELNGMHRFKDDPLWGQFLMRLRQGQCSQQDLNCLNAQCFQSNTQTVELPEGIRYATYCNKDRDAINVATFEQFCLRHQYGNERTVKCGLLVFADNLTLESSGKGLGDCLRRLLYEECSEDDIKLQNGRMDPVLRLYPGCPLMLTENIAVEKGAANGTQVQLEKLFLSPGEQTTTIRLQIGTTFVHVPACRAAQVHHVCLRHCNDRIEPPTFSLKPCSYSFETKLPSPKLLNLQPDNRTKVRMKALQLPFVSNTATTIHKLQGVSLSQLFVHSWQYKCPNWIYVALSRVRTRKGLIFRQALKWHASFASLSQKYHTFIECLQRKLPNFHTDDMSTEDLYRFFHFI